jgi:hypothetical protein
VAATPRSSRWAAVEDALALPLFFFFIFFLYLFFGGNNSDCAGGS